MNKYISLTEFASIVGVKEATIKRKFKSIPGVIFEKGEYKVLTGTRYPCDIHRYRIKDSADKRYVLLKMISEYKYITCNDIKLYSDQFIEMLRELLSAGLIKQNNLHNHYGANAYDCTEKGDAVLRAKKTIARKEIAKLISSTAGIFVGKIFSEVAS